MRISANALDVILRARGLDVATLATRSGVASTTINDALEGGEGITASEIVSLADKLAVPVEALFAVRQLPLFSAVDFRVSQPTIGRLATETLKVISFVEGLSNTISELNLDCALATSLKPVSTSYSDDEAIALSVKWRKLWGIATADQLNWKDANKLYVSLRAFIEDLGVLVIHRAFNAETAGLYVHLQDGPHTIVINTTRSSKARKLFTLAHEFCHVLLRKEGASNPSVLENRVERFCNKFAANLLAPLNVIKAAISRYSYQLSGDDREVRLFAKNLGISQEALVFRLVEEGYISKAQSTTWRSRFNGTTPPGDTEDAGGGQTDPLQTKRTMFGTTLLHLLAEARKAGQLDEIDIYRLSGLKPRHQNQLFEAI